MTAARAISGTNKPENNKLIGWKPLDTKPRKQELWQALLERDPNLKPKEWTIAKMVQKLIDLPAGTTGPEVAEVASPEAALTPSDPPPVPVAAQKPKETEEQSAKCRWSRNKFVRVIHIICSEDHKQPFIQRDRKLDRQEMDAKGKDSFWETAAQTFNSDIRFDISNKEDGRFKSSVFPTGGAPGSDDAPDSDELKVAKAALKQSKCIVDIITTQREELLDGLATMRQGGDSDEEDLEEDYADMELEDDDAL